MTGARRRPGGRVALPAGFSQRWNTNSATKALLAVVAILAVTFGGLLGPFDLQTFLHAGRQVVEGESPYVSVTSAVFKSGHAFVYPMFVAWLFAPLAALPGHAAALAYLGASTAAIVGGCRLLGRSGGYAPVLVLVSSTTIIGLQMGTVNAFLFFGLACAWRLRATRPAMAGLALGIVAAAKLFLLPLLLWFVIRRRYAAAAAAVGTAVVLIGAGSIFGPLGPFRYVAVLSKLQHGEQQSSWSLSSFLQGLGLNSMTAAALALGLALIGFTAVLVRRDDLSEAQLMGLTVLLSLLVSPIVWSSYLLLLSVPLLLTTSDDRPLAVAALVSWVVVTPDAASPSRMAIGVLTALTVAWMATRPRLGADLSRLLSSAMTPSGQILGAAAVLLAAAFVDLPGPVQSPLPALSCILAVALWAARRRARAPTPEA